MVDPVLDRIGHLLITAIDRRRAGVDEVAEVGQAACQLQHRQLPGKIGVGIGEGMGQGITHARLGREMNDYLRSRFTLGEAQDALAVRKIELMEGETFMTPQAC